MSFYSTRSAVHEIQAIRTAEIEVAAATGSPVIGMDSASDIYHVGCKRLGIDVSQVPYAGMRTVFKAAASSGYRRPAALAMDSAAIAGFEARFPGVKLPRVIG